MSNSKDSFDRYPYLKHSTAEPPKVKLTFEEWLHHRFPAGVDGYAHMLNINDLEQCWKAAQENK